MEASRRIKLVGEAEQVGLVAPAAVVEEKQALGVAGGEPLPILQGLGHDDIAAKARCLQNACSNGPDSSASADRPSPW